MDIKIGFVENGRELALSTAQSREEVEAAVRDALSGASDLLQLDDSRGRRYIVRTATIAYVEIGTATQRSVGFGGA
ncbi:Protein of uncharacterised function (DUF3107) [Corynebacterium renale]|uniref:Uncharacterized protein DUF3107 n=1 Tax=Corynebacterium renale TaxID=1724 RepID=A0A2A9DKE0_9CORY|nr:DUF3107 domain-containing protein [Corynebacterium renale]PFG27073.1 uncharacterized protein DUF3107 [Corynebacterium renale]SQG64198.1 Protein of uncharacterised function (DUF3107) [Corynebacterium renale]SQI24225.1 Protein of uncharacterised function (DUF3107) [Corynebacterium renale]STC94582.1 Protein of uncharacterised function (DUF3107) [Corynebacterium renale]